MKEPIPVLLTNELTRDFLMYTTAIYNRALPDIIDGLKVAQRRAILGLSDLHLSSTGQYCKVSRLEGHVLGKYHPQGGCAGTIINLGQQSATRYALTDIHGNVGGSIQTGPAIGQVISEDAPAAPRYLEVRSTQLTERVFLSELNRELGKWKANYDDSTTEPVRIIPSLPSLLLTGAQGIASGYACYHLSYRLSDVISVTRAIIRNRKITDKQIIAKMVSPPELPQGGKVSRSSDMAGIILTGKGQVEVWGEWEVMDKFAWKKRSSRPALIITRLAHGSSERFLDRVRDLSDMGKLPGLIDVSDHSTRSGIRIVLVAKTVDEINTTILPALIPTTGLKHTYNINCTAVGLDGTPRLVGIREVVEQWYEERVKYLVEKHTRSRDRLRAEREKLSGVVAILSDLDRFIKLVRKAKDSESAVVQIGRVWNLSRLVSSHLLSIPIRTLIKTEMEKVKLAEQELVNKIAELGKICSPGPDLDKFIISSMPTESSIGGFSPRCSWKTNREEQAPAIGSSPLSTKDQILAEGKTLGLSTRAVNSWIKENVGRGKILEKWEEHKKGLSAKMEKSRLKPCSQLTSPSPKNSGKKQIGKQKDVNRKMKSRG